MNEQEMTIEEVLELNLKVGEEGRIYDDFGNEYRNEDGCCCFLVNEKST